MVDFTVPEETLNKFVLFAVLFSVLIYTITVYVKIVQMQEEKKKEKKEKIEKKVSLAKILYSNSIQKSIYVAIEIALFQQE